jgi:hypothetical protein
MLPDHIPVVLSAAKDLTERSDADRVAGVRSFAALRMTVNKNQASGSSIPNPTLVVLSAAKDLPERSDTDRVAGARFFAALRTTAHG